MYLHEDKGLFFDVVNAASEKIEHSDGCNRKRLLCDDDIKIAFIEK